MKFYKHAFMILLVLFFCLVPVVGFSGDVGMQAPDFKLKALDGQEVSLSDFKGRLVLLKLGTTWCPTCKQMMSEIKKIGDFLQEKDVVVLDVFVQDSEKMIKKYLGDSKLPMTFHALLDDGQAYEAYNVYLIPRLLVVDAEQVIRFDSAGGNVFAGNIIAMVEEYAPQSATDVSAPETLKK